MFEDGGVAEVRDAFSFSGKSQKVFQEDANCVHIKLTVSKGRKGNHIAARNNRQGPRMQMVGPAWLNDN